MGMQIGFVGVGEMGLPMARNLIKAGYALVVFDKAEEPLRVLQKEGVKVATSLVEVARDSQVIVVMVRTSDQAEAVIAGRQGLLTEAGKGSTILLMSTVHPGSAQKLAGLAKEAGATILDCPVSGASQGAEAGTLTIMVGGREETYTACRPLFEVLGKNIFYLGESGMGESAKLINNLLLLIHMTAGYEAVRLGEEAGVKMNVLFDLIKVSTGNSWIIEHWDMVKGWKDKYEKGGTLDLIYKDINLTLQLGESLKVPLHLSSLAKQLVRYE